MKRLIGLILLFISCNPVNGQAHLKKTYTCHFVNTPAPLFFEKIKEAFDVTFYYKSEWIYNTPITVNGDSLNLETILERAFSYTQLGYLYFEPNSIVIVKKSSSVYALPETSNYYRNQFMDSNEIARNTASVFLKGRKAQESSVIKIGSKEFTNQSRKVNIRGLVYVGDSEESLVGATLYIPEINLGAASNEDGFLRLSIFPGEYSSEIRCIGMRPNKCKLIVYSEGDFKIEMERDVKSIDEVTVNANQDYKIRGNEIGLDKIEVKDIKELPSFMGERDIIRVSQLLPGVVSVNEGSGGLNVRGGNVDQNILYVNQIPLYNTSHAFGFFSAVNPFIVNNFSMYKGFVPTQFGGRLSGIFVVESRKGNKNKLFAQGGISPVSANIEIEGPIVKDKCSVVLSSRSTYSDWILNRVSNTELQNSSISFYDFSAGIDFEFNEDNKLQVLLYGSHDYFKSSNSYQYSYNNFGAGLNYFQRISANIKANYALVFSQYNFSTIDESSISAAYNHRYKINHTEAKAYFTYNTSEKNSFGFGGNIIDYNLNRGTIEPYGLESERQINDLGIENGIEGSFFIDDNYKINNRLKINAGVRFSYFMKLGPNEVNTYEPNSPRDENFVSGVKTIGKNEIEASYTRPELRLGLDFKTSTFSSFKLGYTELSQYLFLLSSTYSMAPTDQWKMADKYIKPGFSRQYSVGYYLTFPSLNMSVSTEGYFKKMKNILEFKDGADLINTKKVETIALQGDQDAYGVELMVAKDEGRINGWISYTYSRSLLQVDGENSWDKINNGDVFASNYDKPNALNIVANFRLSRRLIFSTAMVYSTGRPITLPQSVYLIEGARYIDYSKRNEFRVPDYFRLDFSVTLEGNLRAKKLIHSNWMLNVYNATGQKNPYSIYFRSEEGGIKGYKYSVIGVPIITVSWNFKLGNYANE